MADKVRQLGERHAIQAAVFRDAEGHDLKLGVRKALNLGRRRELEHAGDLLRRHIVRVDGKAQVHDIPQGLDALEIFLVSQAGNGVPGPHLAGKLAGHQIGLVIARCGDKDIRRVRLRLAQYAQGGAAPADAHGVHGPGGGLQRLAPQIDEGDVVPLAAETLGDGDADLARARNYNSHGSLQKRFKV